MGARWVDARGEVGKDEGGEIFVVEEEEGEEDSVVGCVCKTVGWDDIDVELFSVGPVLAGDKELLTKKENLLLFMKVVISISAVNILIHKYKDVFQIIQT